jgi:hypothetical protein
VLEHFFYYKGETNLVDSIIEHPVPLLVDNPGGTAASESPRMLNPTTGGYLKHSTSSFGDILDNETWNN